MLADSEDPSTPLYRALYHTPLGHPDHEAAVAKRAAANRDLYPTQPDSGLIDRVGPVSQGDELAAHESANAEAASHREFGPDYQRPVVYTATGPLRMEERVHYGLHNAAAAEGIPQDVFDYQLTAFLNEAHVRTPAATAVELVRFPNWERGRAKLLAQLPADAKKAVEPWFAHPTYRVAAWLSDYGTPPSERDRGPSFGHVLHAGAPET